MQTSPNTPEPRRATPARIALFSFVMLLLGALALLGSTGMQTAQAAQPIAEVKAGTGGGTPSPTPTSCPDGFDYVIAPSSGATIVPGTDDVGLDCQFNCTSTIDLPFPFTLYDRTFTTAIVGSNGILGFDANSNPNEPSCLTSADFSYAIIPDWEFMVYRYGPPPGPQSPGQPEDETGVFTSVSGDAPNRIFNIEWRARDQFNVSPIDVEVRLYENSPSGQFDMIYGAVNHHGSHAVVGVQKDTGSRFTQYFCLRQGIGLVEPGTKLTYTQGECGTAVPTATNTDTPTPTNTPTITNTVPPVDTPIPSPTACDNYMISPSTGATIVPGTTDTGMHCSECSTQLDLPFPFTLYDRTFTGATITSKGTLGFVDVTGAYYSDCLPDIYSDYAIFPHWDDLDTSSTCGDGDCGVYTSISGVAPNRIFNIEWRARYHNLWNTVNFEIRLYEGQTRFDLVYGMVTLQGENATVGVQKGTGSLYAEYSCSGYNLPEGLQLTFTLGTCSTTPTPAATSTDVPATDTPSVPTDTPPPATDTPETTSTAPPSSTAVEPTSTLTACAIQFSDVPEGSTFYPYVRCLVCRGIVTGYADNTFRPGNLVTRGQAAKITASSAGYDDAIPTGTQTFVDVPPTSTYWLYIERMAQHNAISGYACGGAGEPCPGTYFRPASNLTRGQLAKIDATAAGYINAPASDQQTFRDVPPESTFWSYVEQLAVRGAVSGYACGGAGEPCPGTYFRPESSLTRGQAAKVISSTFFPDCVASARS